jgi:CRP/FNR family transcriptional regulator
VGDNPDVTDSEESQSPVELLRSVPLFADLEAGELERFSHVAVPRSFPAATRVFHEGDHSDACYIVRAGSFRVTREHSDGRAITLATLGQGDIFGELAMLDGEVRSASVEALSDGGRRGSGAAEPPPGDHREAGRSAGAAAACRQ